MELETKFALAMAPDSARRDSVAIYRKKTLKQLQDDIGEINWLNYINQVLSITEDDTLKADETENVVVYAMDYLTNVSAILDPNNNME